MNLFTTSGLVLAGCWVQPDQCSGYRVKLETNHWAVTAWIIYGNIEIQTPTLYAQLREPHNPRRQGNSSRSFPAHSELPLYADC